MTVSYKGKYFIISIRSNYFFLEKIISPIGIPFIFSLILKDFLLKDFHSEFLLCCPSTTLHGIELHKYFTAKMFKL